MFSDMFRVKGIEKISTVKNPEIGDIYLDPDASQLYVYDSETWVPLESSGDQPNRNPHNKIKVTHCRFCDGKLPFTHLEEISCPYCGTVQNTYEYA